MFNWSRQSDNTGHRNWSPFSNNQEWKIPFAWFSWQHDCSWWCELSSVWCGVVYCLLLENIPAFSFFFIRNFKFCDVFAIMLDRTVGAKIRSCVCFSSSSYLFNEVWRCEATIRNFIFVAKMKNKGLKLRILFFFNYIQKENCLSRDFGPFQDIFGAIEFASRIPLIFGNEILKVESVVRSHILQFLLRLLSAIE